MAVVAGSIPATGDMSDKPTEPVEDDDDETELETRVVPRRRFVMRGGQLVEITAGPNVETR